MLDFYDLSECVKMLMMRIRWKVNGKGGGGGDIYSYNIVVIGVDFLNYFIGL